jgi:hypothetical protein
MRILNIATNNYIIIVLTTISYIFKQFSPQSALLTSQQLYIYYKLFIAVGFKEILV